VVHPFSHEVFVSHDSSVSVIDASTNSVVTTVPVGDQLSGGTAGLQVAPGSGRIYVAKQFGPSDPGSVFVVDRSTNAVVGGPIPVGVSPSAVAVAPDGSRVLIGNGGSRNISIIDTSTDSVMATVSLDGTADGIAVTSDGSHAYVASQNPALVSVINLATNSVVGTIPVSGNAVGVAITP
jgi:YVTN family beta-propeller protein